LRVACLAAIWALAFLPALGSSSRLTYHEAFVAQGAREILDSGGWGYPRIGGLPWLEKPPLPWWLVAALGHFAGGVTETVARLPSALAAGGLVLAVAALGTRHYGAGIGLLAGAIQATTAWTVIRGRLAEADILLACLVAWALVAFDRAFCSAAPAHGRADANRQAERFEVARWAFFVLLGASALVKGVGYGAVLIVTVATVVLVWDRDREKIRRFWFPAGWALAVVLALAWPLWMVVEHGTGAIALWTMHLSNRLVAQQGPGPFASESWWEYVTGIVGQALPWSPWALLGAWQSLCRIVLCARGNAADIPEWPCTIRGGLPARREPSLDHETPISWGVSSVAAASGDRLLWAWSAGPLILLSVAAVKNAHYTIAALVPWSIWAALALVRFGEKLRYRGWDPARLRLGVRMGFASLALAYGLGFGLFVPWFDRRGVEWAFYELAGRQIGPGVPLELLYDDWDRNAYDSAFGLIPHDLAVRLFYLRRTACWHNGASSLAAHVGALGVKGFWQCEPGARKERAGGTARSVSGAAGGGMVQGRSFAFGVIGRDRDVADLGRLGCVEVVARGPSLRYDRTFTLFRVTPQWPVPERAVPIASASGHGTSDEVGFKEADIRTSRGSHIASWPNPQ
jgi:hypothetical protein